MSLLLFFRPRASVTPTPPPPLPPVEVVQGDTGGGGYPNPMLSSLSRTWNMPGVREVLHKEDELIIETILMAVVNETIH